MTCPARMSPPRWRASGRKCAGRRWKRPFRLPERFRRKRLWRKPVPTRKSPVRRNRRKIRGPPGIHRCPPKLYQSLRRKPWAAWKVRLFRNLKRRRSYILPARGGLSFIPIRRRLRLWKFFSDSIRTDCIKRASDHDTCCFRTAALFLKAATCSCDTRVYTPNSLWSI